MKKTLVALAALAATASFAQSSVTIYGTLDASVMSLTNVGTTGTDNGMAVADSSVSSSVFGFRGSEDLGGGMKAIFQMEGDVQTNNGGLNQNGLFRRAANVGLSSNMGTIELGLKLNPLIAINGQLMPLGGNSVMTSTATSLGYADFYTKNAVTYTTPNIAGLTAQLQYGMGNTMAGEDKDGSVYAFSATYVNGPLSLLTAGQNRIEGATTSSANASSTAASANKNTSLFGAKYALGAWTFGVATVENKTATAAIPTAATVGGTMNSFRANLLGASYQLNNAVVLGLSRINAEGSSLTNVQARYSLSKRTTVYGQYGLAQNGSDGRVNFAPLATNSGTSPAANVSGLGAVTDKNQSGFNFGVIHTF